MHNYNQSLYDDDSNQHIASNRYNQRQSGLQNNPNSSSLSQPEFKIPEVEYLSPLDPSINFKNQTLKLIQANAVLTEIIKDTLLQKYSLNEKIIEISDKIRRLENPHASNQQNQSNPNTQQTYGQILGSTSGFNQMQR